VRPIIRQVGIRKGTRKQQGIDVDWSCSRLSALSPMCRTAILLIALATLTTASANYAQVSAKTHRRTPVRTRVHVSHRRSTSEPMHHGLASRTTKSASHKLTPEEVGEAAGLAIRRERQGERERYRYAASRRWRPVLRSATARATRRRGRTYAVRHFEETAFVSRLGANNAMETDRDETSASGAEQRPHQANVSGAVSDSLRRREAAELSLSSESASEVQPSAGARQVARPEPDDASISRKAEGTQNNVSQAPDAVEDAPAGNSGTETEQASLYIPRGAMPPPLLGSLASLERQNERLEAEGLERIENESDLSARIAEGVLVPIPIFEGLTVNADLPENHRYCRPWTARFLADLAQAHETAFHRPLEVSSAVRTVEYQRRLMETNGNAAPAEGDVVSPHLTGATVDIAKKGMSDGEIAWMRRRLLALEDAGKIDVEEEFHQACFHITVYKSYAPSRTVRPPSKAASPGGGPKHQPEPAAAGTDAATAGF
jgi:hypothetical protein